MELRSRRLQFKENNVQESMEDDIYQPWNGPTFPQENAEEKRNKFQTSVTIDILPPNFQLHADSTRVEELRLEVFKTVLKGSCEDVHKVLDEVHAAGISLADPVMLDPRNDMNALHLALDRQRIDIAEILIAGCSNDILEQVFTLPIGSRTALHQITETGEMALVKKVLNKVSDVVAKRDLIQIETEYQFEEGRPRSMNALHLAAFKGFKEIVKFFLDIGIDINIQTKKGNTALQWAARRGHVDTIRCLLDNHADANAVSDSGSTALHWAVRGNHTESVKLLLEKGNADPNHQRDIGLGYPIIIASSIGNSVVVECLIIHGARINDTIPGKQSALYHAAKGGHSEVVRLLLKNAADVRNEDKDGNNALLLAAMGNYAEIVQDLLSNGDDGTHTNHFGQDVWYFALTEGDTSVLKVVVDHFNKIKKKKSELKPPICVAAKLGKSDKIKSLIDMGVIPLKTDARKNTFIHYAALHNQSEVIKRFSKYVNIDAKNEDGETALHLACRAGNYLAVTELIKKGAKKNVTNKYDENIIHAAASSENATTRLVEFLVDHLIEVHDWDCINAVNTDGENALHIAASIADPEIIWEFRRVRYKDQDNKGNTPFHSAVRPDCEEALDMMLDIYTETDRDVDLNIKNDNGETVMHLAVSAGFIETVIRLIENGADLGCQDKHGNTVLHRLVKATVEDKENDELYLGVVDCIFNNIVRWWCKKETISFPKEDEEGKQIELHRQAILSLVHNYANKNHVSVIGYAFKLGADKFLSKVLALENVTNVKMKKSNYYDITDITPTTSETLKGKPKVDIDQSTERKRCSCGCGCIKSLLPSSKSNIERLLGCSAKERVAKVLNIPPIRELEKMYTHVCARVYAILMLLHIIYMALFTYFGIHISSSFREMAKGNPPASDDPVFVLTYILIPIEPILYILYAINRIMRFVKRKEKPSVFALLNLAIAILNSIFTFVWIILVAMRSYYQDYILAITLCIGWIASISLTRGFRKVHFFYRMLLHVIAIDISRFLFVFVFVWIGFGTAFHVMVQISSKLVEDYEDPSETLFMLFTMVVGMFEINEDWENGMDSVDRSATFMKAFAMVYIVLGTVILLNLLIAMMNDSYRNILMDQQINWRIDTVQIGIELEYFYPKLLSVFRKSAIRKEWIRYNQDERWYLIVHDENFVSKRTSRRMSHVMDSSFSTFSKAETMQRYPLVKGAKSRLASKSSSASEKSSEQLDSIQLSIKRMEMVFDSRISEMANKFQRIEQRIEKQEQQSYQITRILQALQKKGSESNA